MNINSATPWYRTVASTWLVAFSVYSVWLMLVLFGNTLPVWLLFILGGYTVCLHGSLQHEAVHNRPFAQRWMNTLLVFPPLALWYPYSIYREEHLLHHQCTDLTNPEMDPESLYFTPVEWDKFSKLTKWVYRVNFTMAGRLIIGPVISMFTLWKVAVLKVMRGDYQHARVWTGHVTLCVAILVFANGVGGLPVWKYLLCFAFPGIMLTLLRSYTEHRWATAQNERSLIVEGSPVSQLLYLNNNFHSLHHENPALPWYEIRALYRSRKSQILEHNGNFMYPGYLFILSRIFKDKLIDPLHFDEFQAKIGSTPKSL